MSSDSSQQFTPYVSSGQGRKDPDEGFPIAKFPYERNNPEHQKLISGADHSPKGQATYKSLKVHDDGEISIRAEGPRTQPTGRGYAKSGARKPRGATKTTKAPEPVKPVEAPKKKTTSAPAKKTVAQKPKVEIDVDKARAAKRLDTPEAIAKRNASLKAAKESKNTK